MAQVPASVNDHLGLVKALPCSVGADVFPAREKLELRGHRKCRRHDGGHKPKLPALGDVPGDEVHHRRIELAGQFRQLVFRHGYFLGVEFDPDHRLFAVVAETDDRRIDTDVFRLARHFHNIVALIVINHGEDVVGLDQRPGQAPQLMGAVYQTGITRRNAGHTNYDTHWFPPWLSHFDHLKSNSQAIAGSIIRLRLKNPEKSSPIYSFPALLGTN